MSYYSFHYFYYTYYVLTALLTILVSCSHVTFSLPSSSSSSCYLGGECYCQSNLAICQSSSSNSSNFANDPSFKIPEKAKLLHRLHDAGFSSLALYHHIVDHQHENRSSSIICDYHRLDRLFIDCCRPPQQQRTSASTSLHDNVSNVCVSLTLKRNNDSNISTIDFDSSRYKAFNRSLIRLINALVEHNDATHPAAHCGGGGLHHHHNERQDEELEQSPLSISSLLALLIPSCISILVLPCLICLVLRCRKACETKLEEGNSAARVKQVITSKVRPSITQIQSPNSEEGIINHNSRRPIVNEPLSVSYISDHSLPISDHQQQQYPNQFLDPILRRLSGDIDDDDFVRIDDISSEFPIQQINQQSPPAASRQRRFSSISID